MFKLFKKTKLQDNKNVQKEENSASIIPNAKVTLEKVSKKWKYVTRKEIIKKINYASSEGKKYVTFYNSYISEELHNELLSLGYKVIVKSPGTYTGPSFEVTW